MLIITVKIDDMSNYYLSALYIVFIYFLQYHELGSIFKPVLKMKSLGHRKAEDCAGGHTDDK